MPKKILVIITAAMTCFFCLNGCKESPDEAEPLQEEMSETVAEYEERALKTSVQYMEEAEKEITIENMEAELKKIEEELEQEEISEKQ